MIGKLWTFFPLVVTDVTLGPCRRGVRKLWRALGRLTPVWDAREKFGGAVIRGSGRALLRSAVNPCRWARSAAEREAQRMTRRHGGC